VLAVAAIPADLPAPCTDGRPRMPDAPWVRRAAELAGFSVTDCNAVAWFGRGRGRTGFYLWTTREAPEPRPLFARLAGVPVYGTKVRVGWRAQGLTVWLEYGPRSDSQLPPRGRLAELVLISRRLPRNPRPIAMMSMPFGPLRKCRSSGLLRPACPRLIPRVPGWNTYPSYGNPVTSTFGMERGGEFPGKPELSRPPSMLHFELTATRGRVGEVLPFSWPRGRGIQARNGLARMDRNGPVALGAALWGGRHGSLVLAPPFPTGGSQGNHLIFRWREGGVTYFLGLHSWEPFLETVATLRKIVRSIS
jgi:hypothetical protein